MNKPIEIELLAPAKDLACGKEAITHGADAVYIGAPSHGARSAAANSIEDIRRLTDFAHTYNAKVYVTVNTIIYDDELEEVRQMIYDLYDAGVDALIIQDMGIMEMELPPIALHASTQIDTRTAEKSRFLEQSGFNQIVLARELGVRQIAEIAKSINVPIEVFVHGALCVSYSGQCYISQKCFGRSANRGECAQFCRLPLTLKDADGKIIAKEKHLLSLKDMNRSERLEELIDAGARSLKIEGRLKDSNYVKNVTAYYRQKLDELFRRRPEYTKSSSGQTRFNFTPDLHKSFNRGFTDYLFDNGRSRIWSFDTPKSLGEEAGTVKRINKNSFVANMKVEIHNGDGLCFINRNGELKGFRVNKINGNEIFPLDMPQIAAGDRFYRNNDFNFNKMLSKESATRKIGLSLELRENAFGFTLSARDEDGHMAAITFACDKEQAKTPQSENIRRQLSKLGETPFEATSITISLKDEMFIPSSVLSNARRRLTESMTSARKINYRRQLRARTKYDKNTAKPTSAIDYRGNISNRLARQFYEKNGFNEIEPAYELSRPSGVELMECKHCIRYSLGYCKKDGKPMPYKEPLSIVLQNGQTFRLNFDCQRCEMTISDR